MFNLASPKVIMPSALFALLSPGLLLQLPDKVPFRNANAFMSGKTSRMSVLFHALVFLIVYKMIANFRGIVLKPADLMVPTILFVILSPGVLLSIPPGPGGVMMSGETGITQIIVHAIVFAIVFAFLRSTFPKVY